jgi:hypothetical protein
MAPTPTIDMTPEDRGRRPAQAVHYMKKRIHALLETRQRRRAIPAIRNSSATEERRRRLRLKILRRTRVLTVHRQSYNNICRPRVEFDTPRMTSINELSSYGLVELTRCVYI